MGMLPVPEDMKHLINYGEKVIWVLRGSDTVVVSDRSGLKPGQEVKPQSVEMLQYEGKGQEQ